MSGTTVHVANLDSQLEESQVEDFFRRCGPVRGIRLAGSRSYESRFAFVDFETTDSVQASPISVVYQSFQSPHPRLQLVSRTVYLGPGLVVFVPLPFCSVLFFFFFSFSFSLSPPLKQTRTHGSIHSQHHITPPPANIRRGMSYYLPTDQPPTTTVNSVNHHQSPKIIM